MKPGFADFAAAVAARLEKGRETYGDQSFSRSPAELLGEIKEELADVSGWAFVLWSRLHDLEQRLAERIAGAYLLPPDQQQDHDQQGRADPEDDPNGDSAPWITRLEEAANGAHSENREGKHHGHRDHTEGEADGLRIDVVQSRSVWPVRDGGAR